MSRLRQEASDDFTYYESVESFAEHYSGNASVRGALDVLSGKTFGELVGFDDRIAFEAEQKGYWG